jgi:hypothetical protein
MGVGSRTPAISHEMRLHVTVRPPAEPGSGDRACGGRGVGWTSVYRILLHAAGCCKRLRGGELHVAIRERNGKRARHFSKGKQMPRTGSGMVGVGVTIVVELASRRRGGGSSHNHRHWTKATACRERTQDGLGGLAGVFERWKKEG